ncbi:Os02g0710201 [Oryza sativa Japonica Group]|uniref:Os02g0710201 protein n=1 Tax=Oryza sativa subsp. japonica TaxID=39947 RepID=A0A0P0VNM1_ORYSJ|nr:hypothetical protein EE612_013225 [Oryza sativa]BAS80556.1 Os02g0710201 [Oryza sativa Japonica Group]
MSSSASWPYPIWDDSNPPPNASASHPPPYTIARSRTSAMRMHTSTLPTNTITAPFVASATYTRSSVVDQSHAHPSPRRRGVWWCSLQCGVVGGTGGFVYIHARGRGSRAHGELGLNKQLKRGGASARGRIKCWRWAR